MSLLSELRNLAGVRVLSNETLHEMLRDAQQDVAFAERRFGVNLSAADRRRLVLYKAASNASRIERTAASEGFGETSATYVALDWEQEYAKELNKALIRAGKDSGEPPPGGVL